MLHRRLAGALAALSTADRDALLLVADGLSYQEAAQALGVPLRCPSAAEMFADRPGAALLDAGDQVAFLYDIALGDVQPRQRA